MAARVCASRLRDTRRGWLAGKPRLIRRPADLFFARRELSYASVFAVMPSSRAVPCALGRAIGLAAAAGWIGVLLLAAASASCGHRYFLTGTEVTPTPNPSASASASTTPTATPTAGLVFATNNGDGKLSVFSRNLTSGLLTLIGTAAAGAAPGPTGLALSSSASFLYVANAGDHTVREFSVDKASGALAAIGSVSDGTISAPQQIAIDPSNSFLYVTDGVGGSISQYTIAAGGTLNPNGSFTGSGLTQPTGIAVAPAGGAVYIADFGAGVVMSFSIQPGGALVLVSSVPSLGPSRGLGEPRGIAVDPTGAFVYATDIAGGVVSVFAVAAGNTLVFSGSYLTAAVTNQPFDLALANTPAGLFLYTANDGTNTVSDFIVTSGLLSLQGGVSGLSTPQGIAADPNGSFVYVANSSSGQILGYSVGIGGALSSIGAFNTENPANPASAPAFLAITQ